MKARLGHVRKPNDISGAKKMISAHFVSTEFPTPDATLVQFVVEMKGMNAIIRAISGFKT